MECERAGEIRAGEVRSGEVRSGEVRAGFELIDVKREPAGNETTLIFDKVLIRRRQ